MLEEGKVEASPMPGFVLAQEEVLFPVVGVCNEGSSCSFVPRFPGAFLAASNPAGREHCVPLFTQWEHGHFPSAASQRIFLWRHESQDL